MSKSITIKVTSPSFSKNTTLTQELTRDFPESTLNIKGESFSERSIVSYLKGAEGAIIGMESITGPILDQLPDLKFISKYGVGLDNIDLEACRSRNIAVGWSGGVNRLSVAEMTIAFLITLSRNLYSSSLELKQGTWNKNGGMQLSGKTVGLIGVGYIGKEVIRLLEPFHCQLLVNDVIDQPEYYDSVNAKSVSKSQLFAESDFITIHTPLTSETRELINYATLKQMKPSAYLLNTARGGIVNLNDLKNALRQGVIAGAAIDAYTTEPPTDRDLLALNNLFCTPHIGGNAREAVLAMGRSAIHHLLHYFKPE